MPLTERFAEGFDRENRGCSDEMCETPPVRHQHEPRTRSLGTWTSHPFDVEMPEAPEHDTYEHRASWTALDGFIVGMAAGVYAVGAIVAILAWLGVIQ